MIPRAPATLCDVGAHRVGFSDDPLFADAELRGQR
jgi:hypothetical protein